MACYIHTMSLGIKAHDAGLALTANHDVWNLLSSTTKHQFTGSKARIAKINAKSYGQIDK